MPSFSTHTSIPYIGVNLLTHFPSNAPPLPSIHASYALCSSLSRPCSSTLDIIGAGALSPYLIRAHISSRPGISKTLVWNRTRGKALSLVENLRTCREFDGIVQFEVKERLEEAVREGDIVSCSTRSEEPLVKREWLKEGAHLDLEGSYTRHMREYDDRAKVRARGLR